MFCLNYNVDTTYLFFFFSSRRRHTRSKRDWSSDVCSSDLNHAEPSGIAHIRERHDGDFRLPDAADFGFDLLPSGKIHQTFDNGFIEPRHLLQFFRGRRKNPRGIDKMSRELFETYAPQPFYLTERDPSS